MKVWYSILRYNGRYIIGTGLICLLIWHTLSFFSGYRGLTRELENLFLQRAQLIEKSLVDGDLFSIKNQLWRGQLSSIPFLRLMPEKKHFDHLGPLVVGELPSSLPWYVRVDHFDLHWNGLAIGRMQYGVDIINLNAQVFRDNFFLNGLFILALFVAQIFSGLGAIRSLNEGEVYLRELLENWDSGDDSYFEKQIKVNSSKKPLTELLYRIAMKFYEVIKNKSVLEQELTLVQYRDKLTSQVAHDIRSPLSALKVISDNLEELPEDKRVLIRSAVQRIDDIANDLGMKKSFYDKDGDDKNQKQIVLISALIELLVSEKRLQYRSKINTQIETVLDKDAYGIFANIEPKNFNRVLSNLINNAMESMKGRGVVKVRLMRFAEKIHLIIKDHGCGISKEHINRIFDQGVSFGKSENSNSGLGLFHAKEQIEKWGGTVFVESEVGVGTEMIIELPSATPPLWFLDQLKISHQENHTIVVVDDDDSIHSVWKTRLSEAGINNDRVVDISNETDFQAFMSSGRDLSCCLFLFDYELLGSKQTGLDLLEKFGLADQSILVTSRYEEEPVRVRCERLGVKLLPKALAGHVPINVSSSKVNSSEGNETSAKPDLVLIDDSQLNHKTWSLTAKIKGINIDSYLDPNEFYGSIARYHPKTKIYVDYNLANGVKGVDVAQKLYNEGFTELYLATGETGLNKDDFPFLKDIVSKDPPFMKEKVFQNQPSRRSC